jgi:hypothetical protein
MTFTNAEFMTANQKKLVLGIWTRFVAAMANGKTGEELFAFFKQPLYHHLIQHCSFIAHYNRLGFFETYFSEPEDAIRFFSQFDPDSLQISVEYGESWWVRGGNGTQAPYHDINQAMCEAVRPHLWAIKLQSKAKQEGLDVARANALLAKHGKATVS